MGGPLIIFFKKWGVPPNHQIFRRRQSGTPNFWKKIIRGPPIFFPQINFSSTPKTLYTPPPYESKIVLGRALIQNTFTDPVGNESTSICYSGLGFIRTGEGVAFWQNFPWPFLLSHKWMEWIRPRCTSFIRCVEIQWFCLRHLYVLQIIMICGLSYDFALRHLHVAQMNVIFVECPFFHPINEYICTELYI